MPRLLIWVVAIMAGCYRPHVEGACEVGCDPLNAPACPNGLDCGADGLCYDDIQCNLIPHEDARLDDASDAPPGAFCAGTGWLANTCPSMIGEAIQLGATIDTQNACTEVIAGNCVIAAEQIAVVGAVQVTGPRPLVLFARSNIIVATSSTIEAASGSGVGCPTITAGAPGATASDPTGGGPGGSLGGRGGNGGGADSTVQAMSPVAFPVTSLRGGCGGGRGGSGPQGSGGLGGTGGGGIYLIAGQAISIIGTIRAAGGGGGGGAPGTGTSAGGGGGGSGGIIALDAPMITVSASGVLFAEGGGGGGGARGGNGGAGSAALTYGIRAPGGGAFNMYSTTGAQGSGLGALTGDPASNSGPSGGAGGGGGGSGVIKLFGNQMFEQGAKVSPPAT